MQTSHKEKMLKTNLIVILKRSAVHNKTIVCYLIELQLKAQYCNSMEYSLHLTVAGVYFSTCLGMTQFAGS